MKTAQETVAQEWGEAAASCAPSTKPSPSLEDDSGTKGSIPIPKTAHVADAGDFGPVDKYIGFCLTDEHGVNHVFAIESDGGIAAQVQRRINELGDAPMSVHHAPPVKGTPACEHFCEGLER